MVIDIYAHARMRDSNKLEMLQFGSVQQTDRERYKEAKLLTEQ